MPQPEDGPATLPAVKDHLAMDVDDVELDVEIGDVIAAVNEVVRGLPVAQVDAAVEWPARIEHGAVMLAARVWRRRNSPAGVETFGDQGPVYVQRNDPDVAMLLQIGAYTKPAVG